MPAAYLRGPAISAPSTPYELGCTGKTRFPAAPQAGEALKRLRNGGAPYRCSVCRAWHITSQSRETRYGKRVG